MFLFTQAACEAVAILLHYFFTVAFMWLLVEAVLFLAMSLVPNIEIKSIRPAVFCAVLGWGE